MRVVTLSAGRRPRRSAYLLLVALTCLFPAVPGRGAEEPKAAPPPAPGAREAAPPRDAAARAREAESAEARPRETVFTLIAKGRWIMIPLGICSFVLVTLVIERILSLRQRPVGRPGLIDEVFEVLPPRGRASRENVAAA